MKKDVMIYIKGIRDIDGDKDTVELYTKGRYYRRNGMYFLSYDEMEEDDIEPTIKTIVKVDGTKCVTMTKSGKRKSQLIIENGERHQCHYDNGYDDWIMGIEGSGIENDLKDNGGVLNFRYSMDINTMLTSEHEINIVVKECEN